MKKVRYRGVANPDMHKAMLGFRGSSAASPHKDKRTKRRRTRLAARLSSIRDQD